MRSRRPDLEWKNCARRGAVMFKRVNNVRVERITPKVGFFEGPKPDFYRVWVTQRDYGDFPQQQWAALDHVQDLQPFGVLTVLATGRRFWVYRGEWYVEDENVKVGE